MSGGTASACARMSVILFVLSYAGCSYRVRIVPRMVAAPSAHSSRFNRVALYIDPVVRACKGSSTFKGSVATNFSADTLVVEYELGPALASVIENSVRASFGEVDVVESPKCPDGVSGLLLLTATLAKEPYIQVRWLNHLLSKEGGATAEFVVSLSARSCRGQELWHRVIPGYGTADRAAPSIWSVSPAEEQFSPAVEEALSELARNLNRAIATPIVSAPAATQTPER